MADQIGPPEEHVTAGDVRPLLYWLRIHVHPIGRSLNAESLVQRVCDAPLNSAAFLRYLGSKLEALAIAPEPVRVEAVRGLR